MTKEFKVGNDYTFIGLFSYYKAEPKPINLQIVARGEKLNGHKYAIVKFNGVEDDQTFRVFDTRDGTEFINIEKVGNQALQEQLMLLARNPNPDLPKLLNGLYEYLTFYKMAELHWLEQDNTRINAYLTTRLEQASHNAITAYGMSVLSQDLTNSVMIDGIKAAAESLKKEIEKLEVK